MLVTLRRSPCIWKAIAENIKPFLFPVGIELLDGRDEITSIAGRID
jgi:hypothetical protein